MGQKDTGLANNSPNQAEVTSNRDLEQPRVGEDSDSDLDENDQWGGYMPLSQNPNDGEPLYDLSNELEDEEIDLQESNSAHTSDGSHEVASDLLEVKASSATLVEEVWSIPAPKEVDIEMSDQKIDLVKQVMLNIQLPSDSIPAWAKDIPEDQWKDHLLQKLNKSDN